MINTSFLTLLDPRIKPSGSRDPLGFQTIWVQLGRELVGKNLTTITSSIDNFIIALLACYYSFQEENKDNKMEVFYIVEQLGAYFRIAGGHKNNIMGITQAEKNYNTNKIKLGSDSKAQIFGNQKTSGLWGYYSSALMMSGLINKDKTRIEEKGMKIIEQFINKFPLDKYLTLSSLLIDNDDFKEKSKNFVEALGAVYNDMVSAILKKSEFDIYDKANIFFNIDGENNSYKEFYLWMKKTYQDDPLTKKINTIKKIDNTLWVASKVFEFCRTQKGKTVYEVADRIKKSSLSNVQLEPSEIGKIKPFIEFWNNKEFDKAIITLIDVHKKAMKPRSSANWVSIENDGTIKVTVASKMNLPDVKEEIHWQYNYFLHSFMSVAYQVYIEGKEHGKS